MRPRVDRTGIERTHNLIRPYIRVTPVVELTGADLGLPAFPLTLKLELFQHAGSFKTRGAFSNLLTRRSRRRAWSPPPAATTAPPSPTRPCGAA
jgi:threonine dehydratase